eukprot:TRINITY_DN29544_c0_g1_i1.p1 TRINITY_DN29544_c0_g1~~TRINITY_DN29544_c0_g1_i1.p1  ORF type:complete len:338 (-),score=47.55 TRINITY_DN29544_c0_g1_i1:317-1213(-)
MVGEAYLGGQGVGKDLKLARHWFQKAAEQNHGAGQIQYGLCWYFGRGGLEDDVEARSWFFKAAVKHKRAEAQFYLAMCALKGHGGPIDLKEGRRVLLLAGDNGSSEACEILGGAYKDRLYGFKKDIKEAVRWYRRGVDLDCNMCQLQLGRPYMIGLGVEKDYAAALGLLSQAQAPRFSRDEAACYLGILYFEGKGVPRNREKAVELFRQAAEAKIALAQYKLGFCLYQGKGIQQDLKEAVSWFMMAAHQGHADAQRMVGLCVAEGVGRLRDARVADVLFKAAAAGDPMWVPVQTKQRV